MTGAAPSQRIVMLQTLGNAAARLAGELETLGVDGGDWRAEPGEWSARETVAHLAAAEAPFLKRLQRITTEHDPYLPYFGPDVARPDSGETLPEALAGFRAGRDSLLVFLSGLAPEDWERPAVHETMGATTLALQVQNVINHDLEHLAQLHQAGLAQVKDGHA
jgi:hypothetical protein